ncbi:MAG: hypothetical protein HC770_09995 [Pseudanabaena sp. CRU_2_10]|nr:hypothetical protein [Pseudanabaena sp. CRU_2_10]
MDWVSNFDDELMLGTLYEIESTNLSDCLNSKPLQLTIQQSGLYISGSLQSKDDRNKNKSTSENNLTLKGRWRDGKLSVAGAVTEVEGCDRTQSLTITATVKGRRLEGKIAFLSNTSDFTAQIQELDRKPTVNH